MKKNWLIFLGIGFFVLVIGFVVIGVRNAANAEGYVAIDMNSPSVEFITNRRDTVVKVNALNDEGEILLANENFVGMDVTNASEQVINLAIELGYIDVNAIETDPNTVMVTTLNTNSRAAVKLRAKIYNRLDQYFMNNGIWAIVLTDDTMNSIDQEAQDLGISSGKLRLIKSIQTVDPSFDTNVGAKMSIPGLLNVIKDKKPFAVKEEELQSRKSEINNLLLTLDPINDADQIASLTTELNTINDELTQINLIKVQVQSDKQQLINNMSSKVSRFRQNHPYISAHWQQFKNSLTAEQKQAIINRLMQRMNP